jgi:CheY-like chemotaxis protein
VSTASDGSEGLLMVPTEQPRVALLDHNLPRMDGLGVLRRLRASVPAVGVIVFTGLAAWDAQRLKRRALASPEGQAGSVAIVGALAL